MRHSPPFLLWVLCLDPQTEEALTRLQLEHVRLIPLAELERVDTELLTVKGGRSPVEYYWTCGPALLAHLLAREVGVDMITYLDADLFFFGDPRPIYHEFGTHSILVIEHRKGDAPEDGRFNVGLLIFRRTPIGMAAVRRWREQCLEWCFDRREEGRYGDQGYLNDWAERYDELTVLQNLGAGAALWNLRHFPAVYQNGAVKIGQDLLIFYHFSGVRRIGRLLYELHAWRLHEHPLPMVARRYIYAPYLRELYAAESKLRRIRQLHPDHNYVDKSALWGEKRARLRRSVARTNLALYLRFMLVAGRLTL